MNLQEIISEADVLVPNAVGQAQKILWLNVINTDFFNVVKIPTTIKFNATAGEQNYSIPGLSEKDIDRVSVGVFWYTKLNYNELTTQSYFTYDNDTLTLEPAPFRAAVGLVRARKSATTTFTTDNLTTQPDVPKEYHWTLIPALASYLAMTQDDAIKSGNFENMYKAAWNVAAQNYQVEVEPE